MKALLEQLQQLAPLAAQATDGPWHIVDDNDGVVACYLLTPQAGSYVNPDGNYNDFANVGNPSDAAFIAAARNLLTRENLTLIIGLLSNMDSALDTNRVLANRLLAIQQVADSRDTAVQKEFQIAKILNPKL